MIEVTLTWQELGQAALTGTRRQIEAIRAGKQDKHGFKGDPWEVHIEGAAGEMAFAKAMNLFWSSSVNTYRTEGDVGSIEVKTRSRHDYELLVRSDDSDDAIFVLVTGRAPTFRVVGWMRGQDAKQPKWSQTHGNRPAAYFVPHAALFQLEDLKSMVSVV